MNPDETIIRAEDLAHPDNHVAWIRFFHWIQPRVLGLSLQRGLRFEEAMDALQETLVHFSQDMRKGGFDPTKGALLPWVMRLAGWKISEQFRRRRPDQPGEEENLEEIPDPHAPCEVFGADQELVEAAVRDLPSLVSPLEITIFRELLVEHRTAAEVAERHGITRNAVYLHKRHALKRLRELVRKGTGRLKPRRRKTARSKG